MHATSVRRAVIGLAAATAFSFSGVALAENTKLNFASPLPANHAVNQGIEAWLKDLAKASNGEISYEWYPGEVVAKNKQAMASVRDGIVDASYVIDSYTSSELPNQITASKNGGFGADAMVMTGAANEYMLLNCKQCRQDWRKNGVIALVHASTTHYNLACRENLNSAEKLAGRKIRAAGSFGLVTKEFGGVPVNIPITDTYEALQRGQADCTFAAEAHLKGYSFNEVVKYMITAPFGVYMSGTPFLVNADKWEALPDAHKKLIQSKLPDLAVGITERYIEEAKVARKDSEAKGVKWVEPEQSLIDARQRYLKKLVDLAVTEGEKRRITGVREMMETFQPIHEKWKKIVGDIGHDPDKFREALDREIFSKATY